MDAPFRLVKDENKKVIHIFESEYVSAEADKEFQRSPVNESLCGNCFYDEKRDIGLDDLLTEDAVMKECENRKFKLCEECKRKLLQSE